MQLMEEVKIKDIIELVSFNFKMILIVTTIAITIGLVHFLTSPKEYIAATKLLPIVESQNRLSNNLGNLAGLAGIDLNGTGLSTIPPTLYPDIILSTPFSIELMNNKFYYDPINDSILLMDYFLNFNEVSLFNKIKKAPTNIFRVIFSSNPTERYVDIQEVKESSKKLTSKQNSVKSQITSRITAEVDKLNGTVNIQVKMQDPEIAAAIADFTLEYLTNYITDYKVGREARNLEFTEARLKEAKKAYNIAQLKLANFQDQNLNVSRSSVQVKIEELRNEASITFNVYNNLAQEVEQSRIRVQRVMPAFKVLDPAMVPLKESSPRLVLNIVVFGFLGCIGAVIFSLLWPNNGNKK